MSDIEINVREQEERALVENTAKDGVKESSTSENPGKQSGNLGASQGGAIEETVTSVKPKYKKKNAKLYLLATIVLVLCIVSIVLFVLLFQEKSETEETRRKAEKDKEEILELKKALNETRERPQLLKNECLEEMPLSCEKVCPRFAKTKNDTGGVFTIFPRSFPDGIEVYCDLTIDRGGWTLFQRRQDGSVNFTRNWEDYVNGFGNPAGEYWMGLQKIHLLTSDQHYELKVNLEDWEGNRRYAKYSTFSVAGASERYRLRVGGYMGDAGDALNRSGSSKQIHDNQFFSASNQDNDESSAHCSQYYKGGWWFNSCFNSHLNGVYHDQTTGKITKYQGIIWKDWKGSQYSLKFTEMKFRRKN